MSEIKKSGVSLVHVHFAMWLRLSEGRGECVILLEQLHVPGKRLAVLVQHSLHGV